MSNWKYTDATNTVVFRTLDNGSTESCLVTAMPEGNTPEPADVPPAPTYQELRAAAYPPIAEQLGAMWKGGSEEAAMLEKIKAVKALYPK